VGIRRNWRLPVTGIANPAGDRGNRAGEGGESTTPAANRAGDRGRPRHIERETTSPPPPSSSFSGFQRERDGKGEQGQSSGGEEANELEGRGKREEARG
jgi:hypothetical protein